jgi:hypothetical protein
LTVRATSLGQKGVSQIVSFIFFFLFFRHSAAKHLQPFAMGQPITGLILFFPSLSLKPVFLKGLVKPDPGGHAFITIHHLHPDNAASHHGTKPHAGIPFTAGPMNHNICALPGIVTHRPHGGKKALQVSEL